MISHLFSKLYNKFYTSAGATPDDLRKKCWYTYPRTCAVLGIAGASEKKPDPSFVWGNMIIDYFLWINKKLFSWMEQNNIFLLTVKKRTTPLNLISMMDDLPRLFYYNKNELSEEFKNLSTSNKTNILSNEIITGFAKYLIENKITRIAIDLEISRKARDIRRLISKLENNGWNITGGASIPISKVSSKNVIILSYTK